MTFARNKRRAFSLIEMIVAAVLLSGAVVTLCAISARSLRSLALNREYELAWDILDRQLTFIDCVGIDDFIELGEFEGELGDENRPGPLHHWTVNINQGDADNLYRVDMTVSWKSQGRSHQVSASTAFNGTGTLLLQEETTEQG